MRVETLDGLAQGLLTGYFEPVLAAQRAPGTGFAVPLYQPPAGLGTRRPWFTREEIESRPDVQAQLQGRVIAYLSDPLDALMLHIQGSGRLRVVESNGAMTLVRLAYAGSNEQPYRSVGRWLQEQGALRDASWPGIRAWAAQNPERVQAMLWSNPRYVFFREQRIDETQDEGPVGSAGVPLSAGHSIAVDPASIPLGAPVWLSSEGNQVSLRRLVLAQDQGGAITGAVRADLFVGSGDGAGDLAGRLRQNLRLWVLWPRY